MHLPDDSLFWANAFLVDEEGSCLPGETTSFNQNDFTNLCGLSQKS